MLIGAGGMALLALLAAATMLYAASETSHRIGQVTAAQQRTELYSTLSARISDYAVVAIEAANATAITYDARAARLSSRRDVVNDSFERIETALRSAVGEAQGEKEMNRRATWSLGVARMRAQFNALARAVEGTDPSAGIAPLRARLDGFATQFSPLLDAAIGEEQRERVAAFAAIERLRTRLIWLALGVGTLAVIAFAMFQYGLVTPLLRRIRTTARAASEIGGSRLETRLDIDRRDELGLLFANVNRMAARLDRSRESVDADRARLNEIVEERTAALQDANETLERIDANRRRFFSDVSHELRTPLTVILGETEIGLRASALTDGEYKASLDTINARARRLNRRVEDLLRIARSESGRIELAQSMFDFADAAREAVEDVAGLAARQGLVLDRTLPSPLVTIGDADWTRQVISGVLENAIRHSPQQGRIVVAGHVHDETLSLTITDEGPGIPAEEIDRLFTRFERGKTARAGAGFGVGLALARWVMDSQGGNVNVDSPAPSGRGTVVTLSMPRLLEEDE
jgi:signal transduction histidine kinase